MLLHHVAARGTDGLGALDGMFAFALWDERRGALLLARDRAGIKPLYYAPLPDGGLVFASELTAVLAHPAPSAGSSSARGLQSYFFSDYVHPPHTLVEGVQKLPPGHHVEWRDGQLSEPAPYWRWASARAPGVRVRGRLARERWARLGRAVEASSWPTCRSASS